MKIYFTLSPARKRVIKILRDICIQQPDFPKLTEICIKLIRRINDEDGIRELIAKVFLDLWFTEGKGESPDQVSRYMYYDFYIYFI